MAYSDAPELPISVHIAEVLAVPAKDGGYCLDLGGALAVHVFVSWLFVYKLSVGIVGTALTLDFSWWLSALGLFGYAVCGGCPHSWTGFSAQALSGLWEFFKLSVASGVMLAYVFTLSCLLCLPLIALIAF